MTIYTDQYIEKYIDILTYINQYSKAKYCNSKTFFTSF